MRDNIQDKLDRIFFPFGMEKRDAFQQNNRSLAYYTTAETAKKILENKEIWMRNASVMNDYSEIQYGASQLMKLLYAPGDDFLLHTIKCALNPTLFQILRENMNKFFNYEKGENISWKYNTYITCFTEHREEEEEYGRLSMWRAYGGNDGVAIVFKKGSLFTQIEKNNILLSPVEYTAENEVKRKIFMVLESIVKNNECLASILSEGNGRETIRKKLMWILRFAVVSMKHPAFKEEVEWRLVAHGLDLEKDRDNFVIESIQGIPQPIYKIKLKPDELFDLIDHIIIGPKADIGVRNVMCKAFVRLISDSFGVNDNVAEKKVKTSTIPYRPTL